MGNLTQKKEKKKKAQDVSLFKKVTTQWSMNIFSQTLFLPVTLGPA